MVLQKLGAAVLLYRSVANIMSGHAGETFPRGKRIGQCRST